MGLRMAHSTLGVIIARFQVHRLHDGHRQFIDTVLSKHARVLILLGTAPLVGTLRNPLDADARRQMLLELGHHDRISVVPIPDHTDNYTWSQLVDAAIAVFMSPNDTATLYGGRDSFIPHYLGRFPTQEIVLPTSVSGTELRHQIYDDTNKNEDFRRGVIWASGHRYPSVVATVDVGIFNPTGGMVLVRKSTETLWRLPGGFSDPNGNTFEQDARREVYEETGLHVESVQYIGSLNVDDWRYRSDADRIRTMLFYAPSAWGPLQAGDDVAEAKWYPFRYDQSIAEDSPQLTTLIVPEHRPLVSMLLRHYENTEDTL